MRYFDGVLLYVLDRLNGERSISAVLHLLKGKKSSQTIQDAKLFNLSFLFGMLKQLNRDQLENATARLLREKWIRPTKVETYEVLPQGLDMLQQFLNVHPFPAYLNGWKYHHLSVQFWERLSLYTQSLSYSIHENMNFYPITKDDSTQKWVRENFPLEKDHRLRMASRLREEVTTVLEKLPDRQAELFVYRLSGSGRTGLTLEQTAGMYKMTNEEALILFNSVIHTFLTFIQSTSEEYPLLRVFVADENAEWPLTSSTRRTYSLLQRSMTMDRIAEIRQLKISTIEDHLVEIAINVPNFSIDPFVSSEGQQSIILASKQLKSQRLKTIKQHLNNKYSYFEIRLTLCKEGI
ncbi:MAG: helix-turn-helix domain-containing protein [Anaerobacillus sp.]